MVATQLFLIFTPILGEDEPNLTSIFFKGVGWNHQLENYTTEIEHRYQKMMVSNMFLLSNMASSGENHWFWNVQEYFNV